MKFKLGKKDAEPPRGLLYGEIFNAEMLPAAPAVFGHESLMAGVDWGMLGNDKVGNCTICDGNHEHMLWPMEGGAPRPVFSIPGNLSDYTAISGYNGTEATDTGCNMQDVMAYRQKVGLIDANGVRHKIQGSTSLKVGNLSQLAQATYIFGAVSIGVQLPATAENQFDAQQPWSVIINDTIEGGHCIPCVGRNSAGNFLFVTWGRLQAATPAWVQTYMDEALPPLSVEMLNAKGISPEAYDLAALTKYLGEL